MHGLMTYVAVAAKRQTRRLALVDATVITDCRHISLDHSASGVIAAVLCAVNCQRWILGIRWFHFVTNASVTSQTGKEGLAIRICRRKLSIFGHVRRLPHYAWLRMLVQAVNRTSGLSGSASEDDPAERGCNRSRTTLGSTPTTPGGSKMTASLGGRYDPWPVKRSTD